MTDTRDVERNRIQKRLVKADRRIDAAKAALTKLAALGPKAKETTTAEVAAARQRIVDERAVKAHLREALAGIGG